MSDPAAAGTSQGADVRVLSDRSDGATASPAADVLDGLLARISAVLLCLASVEHAALKHGVGSADGIEELTTLTSALECDVAALLGPAGAHLPVDPEQLEMVRLHLAVAGAGVHRVLTLAEAAAS